MNISAKRLLLLDGLGALVTAGMCLLLARFEDYFGMPKDVMLVLSGIALCFAVFSISSLLYVRSDFKKPFRIIITANITYCAATFVLAAIHFEKLTILGIIYFTGEIIIVLLLVYIEHYKLEQGSISMIDKNSEDQ